eukprot:SAG31_NODE_1407_length_8482_cov_11.903291_5_plen_35_part_00
MINKTNKTEQNKKTAWFTFLFQASELIKLVVRFS